MILGLFDLYGLSSFMEKQIEISVIVLRENHFTAGLFELFRIFLYNQWQRCFKLTKLCILYK